MKLSLYFYEVILLGVWLFIILASSESSASDKIEAQLGGTGIFVHKVHTRS
jgi:hypothetical protein